MFTQTRYILLSAILLGVIMVAIWNLQSAPEETVNHAANPGEQESSSTDDHFAAPAPTIIQEPVVPDAPGNGPIVVESDHDSETTSLRLVSADMTNMDAVELVGLFAQIQNDRLFGEAGWVYWSRHEYDLTGQNLYNKTNLINETWFRVDENGVVTAHISFTKSTNGDMLQVTLFDGERVTNLLSNGHSLEIFSTIERNPQFLGIGWANQNMVAAYVHDKDYVVSSSLTDDGKYVMIAEHFSEEWADGLSDGWFEFETDDEELIEKILADPSLLDELMGKRNRNRQVTFVFDVQTGQLLSREEFYRDEGQWITSNRVDYVQLEFYADLPDDVAALFASISSQLEAE